MKCEYCDNEMQEGASRCNKCGAAVENHANSQVGGDSRDSITSGKSKSILIAYMLWALGLIGVGGLHRLYTRRWITGVVWLLTFGLFFVGTIIDFILIFVWFKKGVLNGSPIKQGSSEGSNYNASALRRSKETDKPRYNFNALSPDLLEKVARITAEDLVPVDVSSFKNTYMLTKIPAVEVAQAKKTIAPDLRSEEEIIFLWGTKKFKNGYLITDNRLFYKYAGRKGSINWADAKSIMFKVSLGRHTLFVNGKPVAYESDQHRLPAVIKDHLNRWLYRVLTEVFKGDADQIPPIDFEEKELKAQKRAEVTGKVLGGIVVGTAAVAGAGLKMLANNPGRCGHSPNGQHAYINGVCRYCGDRYNPTVKVLNV